jgi:carbamoyltransferase
MALPLWLREKLFLKSLLANELKSVEPNFDWDKRLAFSEHHLSHAASAFYPSPFQRAAVLTMDGVGEWATTSAAVGNGHKLEIQKEINFPHSLGLLYAAFTYYTGFTSGGATFAAPPVLPSRPTTSRALLRVSLALMASLPSVPPEDPGSSPGVTP